VTKTRTSGRSTVSHIVKERYTVRCRLGD
jgi:hypothetical protein